MSKIKIIPKRNWLTVRREPLGKTQGGILLPEEGAGVRLIIEDLSEDVDMDIEVGQEVMVSKAGTFSCEVIGGDDNLLLIQEHDICAIVMRDYN